MNDSRNQQTRRQPALAGRCASALAVLLLLAGCAGQPAAPVAERAMPAAVVAGKDGYIVKKGDTLYSIALDHGLDYKELAAWNAIDNPNRILVGQLLRVRPAASAPGAEGVQVRPIATGAGVEQRPLNGVNSGASSGANSAGNGTGSSDLLKREPKAGKEPYSEQALARAQAQPKAPEAVVVAAKPEVKPESRPAAKPETTPEAVAAPTAGEAAAVSEEITWIWPASGKLMATFSEGGGKGIDIAGRAGDDVLAASAGKVVYSGAGLRGYGKLVIVKHNSSYLTAYAHNQNVLVREGQSVSKGQKIAEMGNTDADQVKLHFEVRRQGKPVDPLKYLPQR